MSERKKLIDMIAKLFHKSFSLGPARGQVHCGVYMKPDDFDGGHLLTDPLLWGEQELWECRCCGKSITINLVERV